MRNVRRSMRFRNLVVSLAVLCLAGCAASPVVPVQRPAENIKLPEHNLDYGMAYANNTRDAYQKAISDQVAASNLLSSGLIGLGGVIAGLAAFGAHKDAIIGTALFGGTAYALGQWNLNKQRLFVYQAGVEGLNCAVRAVTPLYIPAGDLRILGEALANLEELSDAVAASIERTRNASKNLGNDDANKRLAEQLMAESSARVERARAAVVSGRQFMTAARRAGPELVGAVDRIRSAVDKAVLDTIPDLSAVPKVVGSLAGLAGSFAPGAGVDTAIGTAFAAYGTRSQSGELTASGMSKELGDALDELRARTARLNTALANVQAQLAGYDTAANTNRLADCGVTGVDTALKVTPARVQLKPGTDMSARVVASGGTKPYTGMLLNAPADGLSLVTPLAFDSTFEVVVKKALTGGGPFTVLITDASNPPKQVTVEIALEGTGSGGGAGGATQTTPASKSAQSVLDMIKKTGTIKDANNNVYTVDPDPAKTLVNGNNEVVVTVKCNTKPGTPASSAELKKALYEANANDPAITFAKDANLIVIFKSDSAECVRTGGTASQSGELTNSDDQQLRTLPAAQIRMVQRSLCMPAAQVKQGVWGPLSREALKRWRTRRGTVGTGSFDSVTKQEFAALLAGDARDIEARCQQ